MFNTLMGNIITCELLWTIYKNMLEEGWKWNKSFKQPEWKNNIFIGPLSLAGGSITESFVF